MPATEHNTQAKEHGPMCRECGRGELRPIGGKLLHRILSLQRYTCSRCGMHELRFRATWWLLPKVLLLVAILVIPIYYRENIAGLFRSKEIAAQNETEALARARTAMGGQLSTFEQMMTRKPRATLDNATILRLWRAKVGTNIILQMIRTSNPDYDLSANAIILLRQAEVDQSIILAMIDTSYSTR